MSWLARAGSAQRTFLHTNGCGLSAGRVAGRHRLVVPRAPVDSRGVVRVEVEGEQPVACQRPEDGDLVPPDAEVVARHRHVAVLPELYSGRGDVLVAH